MPSRMQRVDELARHQRLLLLQGPNGPFFRRLCHRLRELGASATRVNFNAGDDLFHPRADALCFAGSAAEWPAYLERVLNEQRIQAIVLFGQERPVHRQAMAVAQQLGITVVVFEEGYVRPCWITMEQGGVNGASALMQPMGAWSGDDTPGDPKQKARFRFAFFAMALYTFGYGLWACLFWRRYPQYQHHRPLRWREGPLWLRAGLRRWLYGLGQRALLRQLVSPAGPGFFLVPLQMATDSQIQHHSGWACNEHFIEDVLRSFAQHAGADEWLVFKHHPLEIGHAHYGRCIAAAAQQLGVSDRVRYVHSGHLPSLLGRARGVVLVNSTVGLQALHHGTPVLACGRAIYAKPGLVHQGSLDGFWRAPTAPDPQLYSRFLNAVIARSQVNASFYAPGGAWPRSSNEEAPSRTTPTRSAAVMGAELTVAEP